MQRIELEAFFTDIFRVGLRQQASFIFPLYESKEVVATLYELEEKGTTLEVNWKNTGRIEFIALDRREANDIDTFIWAFADFEWLVIDDYQRRLLQHKIDQFNSYPVAG